MAYQPNWACIEFVCFTHIIIQLICIVHGMLIFSGYIAIIINQKEFLQFPTRTGTDIDAESLTNLFTKLGFYIKRYDSLNAIDFRRRLLVCKVQQRIAKNY